MEKLNNRLFSKENILEEEKMKSIEGGVTDVCCDTVGATSVKDKDETCADEGVVGTHLWSDIVKWVWPTS